jgi:hypothetical protein
MTSKYAQLYIADAPAGLPTEPAPAAAPEPAKSGIMAAMAELDAEVAKPDHAAAPDKPVPNAPAPKPDAKATAPDVKPVKPESVPDEVGEGLWRTAPKHLKNDHYKFKRETEGKISEYERKVKELESKSTQSPADLAKIKSLEERSAQLEKDLHDRESRLIQADYSKSEEFKRLYVDKGARAYTKAIGDIKNLKVRSVNAETGEESERPATQADFDAIRRLDPYEQDKKLQEMFGHSSARVAWHINELNGIESSANEAIESAREKSEAQRKEFETQNQSRISDFANFSKSAQDELVKNHPGYFAPDPENPEATTALQKGYDFVDSALNSKDVTPREHAEKATVIRSLAAVAPRLMVERKQDRAKIASLEAELAKFRKSSPTGADLNLNPAAPVKTDDRGISAASKAFDDAD